MLSKKNSLEEQLIDLEGIVNSLKNGNALLDEALEQFQAGAKIGQDLEKRLAAAEKTVTRLIDKGGTERELDPQNAATPKE